MWSTVILNATLSIIIIFIAHHIWEYCKTNYTTQKTKNLVEIQASKYRQIAEDIERNSTAVVVKKAELESETLSVPPKLSRTDFIPEEEKEWVHKELTTFIDTL